MISEAAKMKDMMQIEAGQKLIEFGVESMRKQRKS